MQACTRGFTKLHNLIFMIVTVYYVTITTRYFLNYLDNIIFRTQDDVNIFNHLTCFSMSTFFATLTGNDASNRLNIIKFVISRSISVEIDTSLALFQKNIFCGPFVLFFSQTTLAEFINQSC